MDAIASKDCVFPGLPSEVTPSRMCSNFQRSCCNKAVHELGGTLEIWPETPILPKLSFS